jgi:hypothetical protein
MQKSLIKCVFQKKTYQAFSKKDRTFLVTHTKFIFEQLKTSLHLKPRILSKKTTFL